MLRPFLLTAGIIAVGFVNGCAERGYKPLFNYKDFTGWYYQPTPEGGTMQAGTGYHIRPADKVVYCSVENGGRLMTEKLYSDFDIRFDYKLTPNANNGIGIRAGDTGNPTYNGMEIQVLDDSGSMYTHLHPGQYNGSIYEVVPAERGHLKPVGEWNTEEIIAKGPHITVILNGAKIVDADLNTITDPEVLAKHTGLHNKVGHLALLGHGASVEFRNMRVKTL